VALAADASRCTAVTLPPLTHANNDVYLKLKSNQLQSVDSTENHIHFSMCNHLVFDQLIRFQKSENDHKQTANSCTVQNYKSNKTDEIH